VKIFEKLKHLSSPTTGFQCHRRDSSTRLLASGFSPKKSTRA
jgi:hypothetical protein